MAIFTVRNSSCGKVMLSQVSVCPRGMRCTPPSGQTTAAYRPLQWPSDWGGGHQTATAADGMLPTLLLCSHLRLHFQEQDSKDLKKQNKRRKRKCYLLFTLSVCVFLWSLLSNAKVLSINTIICCHGTHSWKFDANLDVKCEQGLNMPLSGKVALTCNEI